MSTVVMERTYAEPHSGDRIDTMNSRIDPCLEVDDVAYDQIRAADVFTSG